MALTPRLDMRQGQSLVMTPQLQQAIKLLQLSNIELTEYVEQELEQNPLLERDEREIVAEENNREAGDSETDQSETEAPSAPDTADTLNAAADSGTESGTGEAMDVDYDNEYTSDAGSDLPQTADAAGYESWSPGGNFGGDDMPGIEQTLADEQSMRAYLLSQVGMIIDTPHERLIGVELIDTLNESGYVSGGIDAIAERLGCELDEVEAVLKQMQTVEPPGLFARDLKECLALQLSDMDRLDPAMQKLLDNLELMANRDLKALVKVCGVDADDIRDMVAEIRALDPKPGRAFTFDVAETVIPDVIMKSVPDGGWALELNSQTLPRVLVNNRYYTEVSQHQGGDKDSAKDKQYLNECLQSANWLVKSLHQRATTILKVSSEIVRQQDSFFRKGVSAMKPLVLRDIADVIEMHESTVSRVTSNKYMATPRGIFELKYFFSSSVGGDGDGAARSAAAVKSRINHMVEAEDPKKILSDDKIVELLKSEGIDVARRTVAKYRDALGIASSVQRRKEKSGAF
ncbi:MAG: RNA polymerase factor sigma-54 [Rhodospirillaceae bacterium]|nr:RNA polymerase factor sigma-54 [Rhodospirillaceae bacterium]